VKKQRSVGVYWGRFNPPHKGHLDVVRRLRRQCDLTVAIGSAEHRGERRNPFSGAERKAMLGAYLRASGIRDVRVLTLSDGPSLRWAIDNLIRRCRPDILFLSTERSRLAAVAARKVRVVRFARTGRISSTRIRDSIASGRNDWVRLTGRPVVRWIRAHDGIAKIRQLYGVSGRTTTRPYPLGTSQAVRVRARGRPRRKRTRGGGRRRTNATWDRFSR